MTDTEFYVNLALILFSPACIILGSFFYFKRRKAPSIKPRIPLPTLLTALGMLLRQVGRSAFVLIVLSPLSHFTPCNANLLSCIFSNFLLSLWFNS